jgi:hypothetical protein
MLPGYGVGERKPATYAPPPPGEKRPPLPPAPHSRTATERVPFPTVRGISAPV